MMSIYFFNPAVQPYHDNQTQTVVIDGLLGTFYLHFKHKTQLEITSNMFCANSQKITKYEQTYLQLIKNFSIGLIRGFKRYLMIKGIGYRTRKKKNWILFKLGYSHLIRYKVPALIRLKRIKKHKLKLISVDWQLLKQTVTMIRSFKRPDVYKAKGIRYKGEKFKLKLGKRSKK